MTRNNKAENAQPAEQVGQLADATADLVGHFVNNLGRLVTDVIGNSARVTQESQGLYVSVARTYVKEAVKTTSKLVGAVSDAVQGELRELERRGETLKAKPRG